jgi:hypothetical protein
MIRGRWTGPSTGRPSFRAVTYRRTVLGSTPANTAAECAHPVASDASRISMISLSDFFTVPPVRHARAWSDTSSVAPVWARWPW